tara:strand:- start:35 stop:259 length:225 start_codon:yes stop_codon:yes gene_type:complete
MRKKLRNFKPYEYKVYNSENELENYSGGFMTEQEAIDWYNIHGVWLEQNLNRELILIDTDINLFTNVPRTLFNR